MKNFHNTKMMMSALLKRDWIKYIVWLLAVLAYAASGAGKFVNLVQTPAQRDTMYSMFASPAMSSLFGPMFIKQPSDFTAAVAFGTIMPLLTVIVFAIVSVIYVINRTRKDEDEGIAELFRSFRIGKLSSTTAVVIELAVLQLLISLALAGSIQAAHVAGMMNFSDNLLFAATIGAQSFLWGMVGLVFAQIFSNAGSAKGATFGLLGLLYILRIGTDAGNVNAGWFNPLSWSYLTEVYVKNSWTPIVLTLVLALILVVISFVLEVKRDVAAGFIPERTGKAHAGAMLKSYAGLVFRQQRNATIGWLVGIFLLGMTYGSMAGKIGDFIKTTPQISQMFDINPALAHQATALAERQMLNSFLSTIFMVLAVFAVCFGVTSLTRMASEERKNRLEQLYATPLSRFKLYATYTWQAWLLVALAQFVGALGLFAGQSKLSFVEIIRPAMVWTVGIVFMLSLLSLLIAFLPRLVGAIWAYIAFVFFMSYIGASLDLPKWLNDLNVFHHISRLPVEAMNWTNFSVILILALIFTAIAYLGYRRRDLISG